MLIIEYNNNCIQSINDAKFIKVNNDDSCSIQTKGGMSPQEMSYGGTIIRGGVLHKACIKSYNAKKGGNLKSYNKKKGGNILYNAEFKKYVITDTDLLEEIIEYCQTVDNTEIDLMKKITHIGDPFIQFGDYPKLNLFIESYSKNLIEETFIINMKKIFNYKTLHPKPTTESQGILKKEYKYYDYNKAIIKAYEYPLLKSNQDYAIDKMSDSEIYSTNAEISDFIKEQLNYIEKRIDVAKKRTIQDYTKIDTSFYFYTLYKNKKMEEFAKFGTFSDAFFPQIHNLFPSTFNLTYFTNYIMHTSSEIDQSESYNHWLNNPRKLGGIDKKEEDERDECVPGKIEGTSIFFGILSPDQWEKVIEKFIYDITDIILNAPEVKTQIHGYRGVSGHYIYKDPKNENEDFIKRKMEELLDARSHNIKEILKDIEDNNYTDIILSDRFSSVSFNFDASYGFFARSGPEAKRAAMYRVTIEPRCQVLFIAPFSAFPNEFEILIPPYHTMEFSVVNCVDNILRTSNNINKTYTICIDKDFKSYDNTLKQTLKTMTEYTDKKLSQACLNTKVVNDSISKAITDIVYRTRSKLEVSRSIDSDTRALLQNGLK